jgi:apolipoprotein N-acyltransferase
MEARIRPRSVTVVGGLIVLGAIGGLGDSFTLDVREKLVLGAAYYLVLLGQALHLGAGVAILAGRSWGRLAYVAIWLAFQGLAFWVRPWDAVLVASLGQTLFFLVCVYFLTRPATDTYFGGSLSRLVPRYTYDQLRRPALLAAFAVASFLCFPHPVAGRVLDLGLVLGFAAPGLLVLGLHGLAPARAAGAGFAAGLAAHAAILHWIYVVTVVYGGATPLVGVLAPLALAIYPALATAAFGAALALCARRGPAGPFAVALCWTACDHARSFALTGFPWALLGYSQHRNPALLGLAAFTGVYGLSFACALGGAAAARAWLDRASGRRPGAAVWSALAALALAHAFGLAVRAPEDPQGLEPLRVAVLQGNIDQGVKWSPAWASQTLAIYEALTRQASARGARVVVWPESALPGGVAPGLASAERLGALARETGAALVVGAVHLVYDPSGRPAEFYDSAFLVDPQGALVDRYDKSHLVPFGEYVPLRAWLGRHVSAVARGIAAADVSAGPGPRALQIPGDAAGGARAGVAICYELIFPDLVRRFVGDGARVLFAITNDAWYGRTGAPYQFLAMTALRSAENRIWTARAANTGVSAIIDARGRVRASTQLFERDLLVADVPLRAAPLGGSFYARHGDVFAAACWAGALGLVAAGLWRSRRDEAAQRRGGRERA